ncbi:MAG: hypothetical protein JW795_09760 [Chitinivibrionales bacterium]|nr:hypothetical protein [Chitinivibrionales bacterium]
MNKTLYSTLVAVGIVCVIKSFVLSEAIVNASMEPPDAMSSIMKTMLLSSSGVIAVVSGLAGLLFGLKPSPA